MSNMRVRESRHSPPLRGGTVSLHAVYRRVFRVAVGGFFVVYSVFTLIPLYLLFVRTFVSTKDATELWLWVPPAEEINMNAEFGNLAIYYNLDPQKVKKDFEIPASVYIKPSWTLARIGEEYGIPEEEIKRYFGPFVRYNGWLALLSHVQFFPSVGRTILLTAGGILGLNVLSILTGTALARLRRRYQMFVYNLYLFQTVIPIFLILVPQFVVVQWLLGLIPGYDSPGLVRQTGQLVMLVIMYAQGGALSTMIYTSFIATIPQELEDAAEIDGASRWQYMRYIQLPLMKIPVASLTVIALTQIWNNFLAPYVYLDAQNTTLLPLIQSYAGQYSTNFQAIYTGVFLSALPLVVIYLSFRRWFIRGVMAGAIKG